MRSRGQRAALVSSLAEATTAIAHPEPDLEIWQLQE